MSWTPAAGKPSISCFLFVDLTFVLMCASEGIIILEYTQGYEVLPDRMVEIIIPGSGLISRNAGRAFGA